LVKVKAHRGEPANEGADILADKAISDPKVGKEWCQRTNRAVMKHGMSRHKYQCLTPAKPSARILKYDRVHSL